MFSYKTLILFQIYFFFFLTIEIRIVMAEEQASQTQILNAQLEAMSCFFRKFSKDQEKAENTGMHRVLIFFLIIIIT